MTLLTILHSGVHEASSLAARLAFLDRQSAVITTHRSQSSFIHLIKNIHPFCPATHFAFISAAAHIAPCGSVRCLTLIVLDGIVTVALIAVLYSSYGVPSTGTTADTFVRG